MEIFLKKVTLEFNPGYLVHAFLEDWGEEAFPVDKAV